MLQSGVILFSIPRLVSETYGTNGWLVLPIYFLIVSFNIWLISLVYRLSKGEDVFLLINRISPKLIRNPIYFLVSLFWVCLGIILAKKYTFIIQTLSFPTTPTYYLLIVILLPAVLFTLNSMYNIVKGATLFFYLGIWMVFLTGFFMKEIELSRYSTHLLRGGDADLQSMLEIYVGFTGYEFFLFLFPYLDEKKKPFRAMYIGHAFTSFIYIYVTIICIGFFGFNLILDIMYPTLQIYSNIEFPFLIRIENIVFSTFYFKIIVTVTFFFWTALTAMEQIFSHISKKIILPILLLLGCLITMNANTSTEADKWLTQFGFIQMGLAFLLPLILIIILKIKKS